MSNADNLLWCLLPAAVVNLYCLGDFTGTSTGFGLAIASGAVATGFGYIVWYLAMRDLSAAHAATVELSMPAIAALGGVAFLAEPLSLRLLIASAAMLGEIAIVVTATSPRRSLTIASEFLPPTHPVGRSAMRTRRARRLLGA